MRHNTFVYACFALAVAACGDKESPKSPPPVTASAPGTPTAPLQPGKPSRASFEDGIRFSDAAFPDFVANVTGFSVPEPWGRWTVGPQASITFSRPLPEDFELVVVATAYKENVGERILVTCGNVTQPMTLQAQMGKGFDTRRLPFKLAAPADKIEISIPKPTVPPPETGDSRPLGIAVRSITIVPTSR